MFTINYLVQQFRSINPEIINPRINKKESSISHLVRLNKFKDHISQKISSISLQSLRNILPVIIGVPLAAITIIITYKRLYPSTLDQFRTLLKNNETQKAMEIVKFCIGKSHASCEGVVSHAASVLINNNDDLTAFALSADCIKEHDASCQLAATKIFNYFICHENQIFAYKLANECIGKFNAECQQVLPKAFDLIINKNTMLASILAQSCAEHSNLGCQNLVLKAFKAFTTRKDMYLVKGLVETCTQNASNKSCQIITNKAKFLPNFNKY